MSSGDGDGCVEDVVVVEGEVLLGSEERDAKAAFSSSRAESSRFSWSIRAEADWLPALRGCEVVVDVGVDVNGGCGAEGGSIDSCSCCEVVGCFDVVSSLLHHHPAILRCSALSDFCARRSLRCVSEDQCLICRSHGH